MCDRLGGVPDASLLWRGIKHRLAFHRRQQKDLLMKYTRDSVQNIPIELTKDEQELFHFVKENDLSMTSNERLFATIMACKYVIERDIPGDFVECGVWRGGNSLLAAGVFKLYNVKRKVYLFDTFEGMTAPTEADKRISDQAPAIEKFKENRKEDRYFWCYAGLDEVQNNFRKAGLLNDNVTFVKGDVLKTLADAGNLPETISVLRLDTDWYESTKAELEILYPRLRFGGILMIDDYGHWAGSNKATDEYFATHGKRPFLQYVDYTGRVGVKID